MASGMPRYAMMAFCNGICVTSFLGGEAAEVEGTFVGFPQVRRFTQGFQAAPAGVVSTLPIFGYTGQSVEKPKLGKFQSLRVL